MRYFVSSLHEYVIVFLVVNERDARIALLEAERFDLKTPLLVDSVDSTDVAIGTTLLRMSSSCPHGTSRDNLKRMLLDSVTSGKAPRCCLCSSKAGVNGRSYLMSAVNEDIITEDVASSLLLLTIREQGGVEAEFDLNSKHLMGAKQCPLCEVFVVRYRDHSCHHISPGSGCTGCQKHFCFACLGYQGDGSRWLGCPNTETYPITCTPNCSDTCMCVLCPDCKPGVPCDHCDDGCPSCRIIVPDDVDAGVDYNDID